MAHHHWLPRSVPMWQRPASPQCTAWEGAAPDSQTHTASGAAAAAPETGGINVLGHRHTAGWLEKAGQQL